MRSTNEGTSQIWALFQPWDSRFSARDWRICEFRPPAQHPICQVAPTQFRLVFAGDDCSGGESSSARYIAAWQPLEKQVDSVDVEGSLQVYLLDPQPGEVLYRDHTGNKNIVGSSLLLSSGTSGKGFA